MIDLDDLCDALDPSEPGLVALARKVGRATTTVYVWSNGRVLATLGTRGAQITRRLGPDPVPDVAPITRNTWFTRHELVQIAAACTAWSTRRRRWQRSGSSCAGYPPGVPSQLTRRRPRPSPPSVTIPISRRCRSTGIAIVAELRSDGELIGLRFRITDQLVMDAWRDVAAIRRGEIAVYLEVAEVGLPAVLVATSW